MQATIITRFMRHSKLRTGPSILHWSISTTTSIAAMMMVKFRKPRTVPVDASTAGVTMMTLASKGVWAMDFRDSESSMDPWIYYVTKKMLFVSDSERTLSFCGPLNVLRCFSLSHSNCFHLGKVALEFWLAWQRVAICAGIYILNDSRE